MANVWLWLPRAPRSGRGRRVAFIVRARGVYCEGAWRSKIILTPPMQNRSSMGGLFALDLRTNHAEFLLVRSEDNQNQAMQMGEGCICVPRKAF